MQMLHTTNLGHLELPEVQVVQWHQSDASIELPDCGCLWLCLTSLAKVLRRLVENRDGNTD